MTAGVGFNTHYIQDFEGAGVFPVGEDEPADLEDLWPAMREPALQDEHQARIQPVDDAAAQSAYFAVGGLVIGFAGIGTAAAVADDSPTVGTVAGVTGLGALLVGAIGALVSQPSGEDQLQAEARRKLFIRGEDDPVAVQRGVNSLNGERRARCGGRPIGFVSQERGSGASGASAIPSKSDRVAPPQVVVPRVDDASEPAPAPEIGAAPRGVEPTEAAPRGVEPTEAAPRGAEPTEAAPNDP